MVTKPRLCMKTCHTMCWSAMQPELITWTNPTWTNKMRPRVRKKLHLSGRGLWSQLCRGWAPSSQTVGLLKCKCLESSGECWEASQRGAEPAGQLCWFWSWKNSPPTTPTIASVLAWALSFQTYCGGSLERSTDCLLFFWALHSITLPWMLEIRCVHVTGPGWYKVGRGDVCHV